MLLIVLQFDLQMLNLLGLQDGMLLVDKKGNMSYLEGQDIIDNIGQNIGISGPSDDVPRLRLIA